MSVYQIPTTREEQEPQFFQRMNVAKYQVSLWGHAARAGRSFIIIESLLLWDMFEELFREEGFFYPYIEQKKSIIDSLKEFFYIPLSLADIIEFIKIKPEYAVVFYEDACNFIIADGRVEEAEKKFLNYLARQFLLIELDKKTIDDRYLI